MLMAQSGHSENRQASLASTPFPMRLSVSPAVASPVPNVYDSGSTAVSGPHRLVTGLTVRSIEDPGWAAFVASQSAATVFHHPAWSRLLAETYGYRSFALV